MEKQFVSFDIAIELRRLGFNEQCLALFDHGNFELACNYEGECYYNEFSSDCFNVIAAPPWQQATWWLREVHNIHIVIDPIFGDSGNNVKGFLYSVCDSAYAKIDTELHRLELEDLTMFQFEPTYEKALESAIINSLKRIK